MSVSRLLAMAALVVGTPLAAQDAVSSPTNATTTALPTPDPERLAIAERVVDRVWPVGTYRRMMETSLSSTVDAVEGLDAPAPDWSGNSGKAARRAQHEARTGRPLTSGRDGNDAVVTAGQSAEAMTGTLMPMFERMEPPLRAALARSYARRYGPAQLAELETFFSTPTGAAYAAHSLTIMSEPEMIEAMSNFTGEMLATMMIAADVAEGAAAEAIAVVDAAAAADAGVVKYE